MLWRAVLPGWELARIRELERVNKLIQAASYLSQNAILFTKVLRYIVAISL